MVKKKLEKIKLNIRVKLEPYFSRNGVYVYQNNKLVGSLTTDEILKGAKIQNEKTNKKV